MNAPPADKPSPSSRRKRILVGTALLLALLALFLGRPIQYSLLQQIVFRSRTPDPEDVQSLLEKSPRPAETIQRLWQTEQIPHRALAASYLRQHAISQPSLLQQLHQLLPDAALDPDYSVREATLTALASTHAPSLPQLAQLQFQDPDPELRLLGLHALRPNLSSNVLSLIAPLLADPEPQVAATAANCLRIITGHDFNVRVRLALNSNSTPENQTRTNRDQLLAGLQQWQNWWRENQAAFPPPPSPASATFTPPTPLPAPPFSLPDLHGNLVSLSKFQGQPLLLIFWTTWSTASRKQIPDLNSLYQTHSNHLALLSICLDGQRQPHSLEPQTDADQTRTPEALRQTIENFVRQNQITFPVLLDPQGKVAAAYHARELPAHALIDSQGHLQRLFAGPRSPATWEKLLAHLPPNQP